METIHAEAYSLLNEELGLDDFSEFLEDETTMATWALSPFNQTLIMKGLRDF